MSGIKADIEIARAAKMLPIKNVLAKLGVPDEPEAFSPMGRHIAKISLDYIKKSTMYTLFKASFTNRKTLIGHISLALCKSIP